jgi:hypothetical protein
MSQYLDKTNSNDKLIGSIARRINMILLCTDFAVLKTLEPYKYLEKIQPMNNDYEAIQRIKQAQNFIRPQYLALVEQMDVGGKYYAQLVKYGRIKDFKQRK